MMRPLLIVALLVAASPAWAAEAQTTFQPVQCEGTYAHHLQGVCTDERGSIFWSFTTQLVKTDARGKRIKQIEVGNHHGDLCHHDGKIYVAVNFGKFNDARGNADSWVYVYDAADLSLVAKHETQDVKYGAGGVEHRAGRFFVVGGLPADVAENYVYEYDGDFKLVATHVLASGHTLMGIQTVATIDGQWWFGCYGKPQITLKADAALKHVQRFEFDCSLGIVPLGGDKFLVARGGRTADKGHTGSLVAAVTDEDRGLRLIESAAAPR